MKIEIANATPPQINWLAAKAEGFDCAVATGTGLVVIRRNGVTDYFDPATNWGWGGPLIDREKIMFQASLVAGSPIMAYFRKTGTSGPTSLGVSHLEASMRLWAAFKLGAVADVPDELIDTAAPSAPRTGASRRL